MQGPLARMLTRQKSKKCCNLKCTARKKKKKQCALFSHRAQAVCLLSGALVVPPTLPDTHDRQRSVISGSPRCDGRLFLRSAHWVPEKDKVKTSTPIPNRGRSCG